MDERIIMHEQGSRATPAFRRAFESIFLDKFTFTGTVATERQGAFVPRVFQQDEEIAGQWEQRDLDEAIRRSLMTMPSGSAGKLLTYFPWGGGFAVDTVRNEDAMNTDLYRALQESLKEARQLKKYEEDKERAIRLSLMDRRE